MDEKTRKELRNTVMTIAISVAALLMGILLIGLNAVHGKISWVGIIIVVAMIINIIPAYRRRKEILEYVRNNQK